MTFKVGVVGVRDSGAKFAEAVNERPDMNLIGVADLLKERADAVASSLSTRAFYDAKDLIDEGLDIIVVVTANAGHAPISIAAMEKGIHVVCEKPISISLQDAEDMIAAEEKYKTKSMVPFSVNFTPTFWRAREMVRDGKLGQILSMRRVRSRGYGYYSEGFRHPAIEIPEQSGQWIIHHGVHDAVYFNDILGNPLTTYTSGISTVEGKDSVEDFASIINYQDGGIAMHGDGMAALRYGHFGINGTKGCLMFDADKLLFQSNPDARPEEIACDTFPDHWLMNEKSGRYHKSLNAMCDKINNEGSFWTGIKEGYQAQRVVVAQTESLMSGQLVSVSPSII